MDWKTQDWVPFPKAWYKQGILVTENVITNNQVGTCFIFRISFCFQDKLREWLFNTGGGGACQENLGCWNLFGGELNLLHASLANIFNKCYKKAVL